MTAANKLVVPFSFPAATCKCFSEVKWNIFLSNKISVFSFLFPQEKEINIHFSTFFFQHWKTKKKTVHLVLIHFFTVFSFSVTQSLSLLFSVWTFLLHLIFQSFGIKIVVALKFLMKCRSAIRILVFGTFTLYKGHFKMSCELGTFQNRKSATELIVLKAKTIRQVVEISSEVVCFGILESVEQS